MAGCDTVDFLLNAAAATDADADAGGTCCGCCCCGCCCLSTLDDACATDADDDADMEGCCSLLDAVRGGVVGTGVGGSGGNVGSGARGVEGGGGGSAAVGGFVMMGRPPPPPPPPPAVVTRRANAPVSGLGPPSSTGPSPPWLALSLRAAFSL